MKGWITTALVVTFLSGTSTGYLLGRTSAPVVRERTLADAYVEKLIEEGVTKAEDLARAREAIEQRNRKIMALKDKIMALPPIREQIETINAEAERELRRILDAAKPAAGNTR